MADLAAQQSEALRSGDFEALTAASRRRQQCFEGLTAAIAEARAHGDLIDGDDPNGQWERLRQTAREILELDRATLALVAQAAKQGGADMEMVRRGRLALNYKSQSSAKKPSKVDLIR